MSMILNDGQEAAAVEILKYLNGEINIPYCTLTGGPGTGKTFLLKEVLKRSGIKYSTVTGATIAHAAKNVLKDSLPSAVQCFTVAQWLGLKMSYGNDGEILFKPSALALKQLAGFRVAILDEASMIDDDLFDVIMREVTNHGIKLIAVGDIYQLPPVSQDHNSKFFDNITARLTQPMRFTGPIYDLGAIYRAAIKEMNTDYVGDQYALNKGTNRQNNWDGNIDSGYKFKSDIYEIINKLASEVKTHPNELNYSRALAFKNHTVELINNGVRDVIYGQNKKQFEHGEIVISNGGYSVKNRPVLFNGELFRVESVRPIIGPYEMPCLSVKFKGFTPVDNVTIPVVQNTPIAMRKYSILKDQLKARAMKDSRQWVFYYKFIESFAYFDYAYAVNVYKAQGQTLKNVYVFEGEIMGVKPLTLKQKYQALYVAVTRATDAVYIYNKDY